MGTLSKVFRIFALGCFLSLGFEKSASASSLQLEVFSAKTANVNSFVFFDSKEATVIDTARTSKEALEVAKLLKSHGVAVTTIFVTHGHPDHYLGLGALKSEFPNAKILVATSEVKNDIIAFAQAAERGHWLDDEPLMLPKSEKHPSGFDYGAEIRVLNSDTLNLPGGEKLQIFSDFPPTEAQHETVLYSKNLKSLFASDLVYNQVHLWLGNGVDLRSIKNWQSKLTELKTKYSHSKIKVYPGHGEVTDPSIFDVDLKYINDFLAAIESAKSQDQAKSLIMNEYPGWQNTEFILVQSINNLFKLGHPK
jgi:glyoxylase-like metal-dependent hydrolase (beta-lactamase superfamily II)